MSEPIGTIRGSSWGEFFDCSLRWYYKQIEGLRLPSRGASVIGSAVHLGTSVFDQAVLLRKPASVMEAVEAAYAYAKAPPDNVDWNNDEDKITRADALDFSVKLTSKYCTEVAPTMTYTAIEVKCKGLDITTDSGIIRVTGTTDRVRVDPLRQEGITDFKTGGKAVGTDGVADTRGHHMQLGVYTLMTEQELKRPMGPAHIVGFQTNSKLRIGLGTIAQPKRALIGTEDKPGLIELAARVLKTGVFPPNPKSVLCSKKWCPAFDRCIYHE